jgi:hypothetical protein
MLLENGLDERLANHIQSLFLRAPVPAYEKEFMFPCCNKSVITPKKAKEAETSPKGQYLKVQDEEAKEGNTDPTTSSAHMSEGCESCNSANICEFKSGEIEAEQIRRGVATKWWTKVPPVDGNSHFENL